MEKKNLWLYILCFMVPSVVPMYCLTDFSFYSNFIHYVFCWQFPCRVCVFFFVFFYPYSGIVCWDVLLWRVSIFCYGSLWFRIYYLCNCNWSFILFLLKILARGLWLEKCLLIRFRKSLPMFDVMLLLYGELNQVLFLFLCFG